MAIGIVGSSNGYGSNTYPDQGSTQAPKIDLQQLVTDLQNGQLTPDEQKFMQLLQQLSAALSASDGGQETAVSPASSAPTASTPTPPANDVSVGQVQNKQAVAGVQASGASEPTANTAPVAESSAGTSTSGASAGNNWGITGKEGLGISPTSANGNGSNMGDASWYSNWTLNPTSGAQGKFVPTVNHLSDASSQSQLESAFKNSGSKLALGFNEPDHPDQANISPSEAASAWGNVAGAAQNTGTSLASPSVTNSGQAGQGLDWLKQFMNSTTNVNGKQEKVADTVDAINLHWYGSTSNPNDAGQVSQQVSDLKNYLERAHSEFPDKPIILSEVGLNASGNNAASSPEFLEQVQQMLKGSDMSFVQLYAPYGAGVPSGN